MPKYEVVRPWNGVEAGQVLELKTVHPSLKSNVRLLVNAPAADGLEDAVKVVTEAKAEAAGLVDAAKAEADRIVQEAKAEAEKLLSEAKKADADAAGKGDLTPAVKPKK